MHNDRNSNTAARPKIFGYLERLKKTNREEILAKSQKYGFNFIIGMPMQYEKE